MAVYALGDKVPDIHPEAYVHPDAVVIGNVKLAAGTSIWPQAVLRGDYGTISVGAGSNIQDGTVIHCTATDPTIIGAGCVVGHNAHIEGSVIGDGCLIASGSIVLNRSVIGAGSIVGAGAVIARGFEVPPRSMALGVPAKIREGYEVPLGHLESNVAMYSANAAHYRDALRRID
ncbi:gamma carbonic anhydrase family protein [Rhodococcus sp. SRB_17]|uniref:gamma carbonic anhydrase family protein n=1 Tax=Rhodococcus sp. OK302 TaxID=1882769 RepID=UPI000B942B1D|nr:gamma carbonic anhydrase family protein [Rhodococcus sp. OK302]NMM91467.1 gamma carbonic anhydrase family protein [Rhodococcus sp. SRB_17]OYD69379.1 carbonic anhydrase/acetyltransferase-like protein (isoleucine patch superfamily) [Rhodococcus sp. OK302]